MTHIKHPRTSHLPGSPGVGSDDKQAQDLSAFDTQDVVVTEKMDGENTTLYTDGYHARSLDSGFHPSRTRLRLSPAPQLYHGPMYPDLITDMAAQINTTSQEGFVILPAQAFPFTAFPQSVMKWVRAGHVQNPTHWKSAPLIPNGLASPSDHTKRESP